MRIDRDVVLAKRSSTKVTEQLPSLPFFGVMVDGKFSSLYCWLGVDELGRFQHGNILLCSYVFGLVASSLSGSSLEKLSGHVTNWFVF